MANLVSQLPPGVPLSSLAEHTRPAVLDSTLKNDRSPVRNDNDNGHAKSSVTPPSGQVFPYDPSIFSGQSTYPPDQQQPFPSTPVDLPSTFYPSCHSASFSKDRSSSLDLSNLPNCSSSDHTRSVTNDEQLIQTPTTSQSTWPPRSSLPGTLSTCNLLDGVKLPGVIPSHEHTVPTYEVPLDVVSAPTPIAGIKPWTPKPHAWTEAPLFDELHKYSGPGLSPASSTFSSSYNAIPQNPSFPYPSSTNILSLLPFNSTESSSSSASPRMSGSYRTDFPASSMSQPQPYSAGYPSFLYSGVPMPPSVPLQAFSGTVQHSKVGPVEYAQAVEAYKHIQNALSYIRPLDASPAPSSDQTVETLIDCSADAQRLLSGRQSFDPMFIIPNATTAHLGNGGSSTGSFMTPVSGPSNVTGPSSSATPTGVNHNGDRSGGKEKRPANGTHSSGENTKHSRTSSALEKAFKPATYCRGCGVTETPEWRRGPLGPRTLCNACGLVHMKMLRKKKKLEEKQHAMAATSGSGFGPGPSSERTA